MSDFDVQARKGFHTIQRLKDLLGIPAALDDIATLQSDLADLTADFDALSPRVLTSGTMSAAALLDLSFASYSAYSILQVKFAGLTVSSDSVGIIMRVSADGVSFDAGASDYKYAHGRTYETGASTATVDSPVGSNGAAFMFVAEGIGSASGESANITIETSNWTDATLKPLFRFDTVVHYSSNEQVRTFGSGRRDNAQATSAIRLIPAAGTMSGKYRVIGIL